MRLIDADALMRRLCVQCDVESHEATCDPDECFVYNVIVYDAPTIEAEPVRHGRWEERFDGRYRQRRTYCTACGQHSGIGGNKQEPPYCPHCGAKMDGGANDD